MTDSTTCKNCDSHISDRYCQNCGQRSSVHKVTFKETFVDFVDTIFSVNTPLWMTLRLLVISPGKLFREYLDGRRKRYYKPVSFFILCTVTYIVLRSLINYDPMAGNDPIQEGIDMTILMEAGRFMVANINNILFLFVFSFAIVLKLFFYRHYKLAEYVAISFYLIAVYNLIGTLVMFYLKYVDPTLKFIPFFLMLIYVMYALISLFKTKKLLVAIKGILAYAIAFVLYAGFGYGLSFLIVWLKSS